MHCGEVVPFSCSEGPLSEVSKNRTPCYIHNIATYDIMHYSGCTSGDIRLVEGSTELEGRVEICLNNMWSTVCDDGWENVDAGIVCRQLGYSATGITVLAMCILNL